MPEVPYPAARRAQEFIREFEEFNQRYAAQFSLKIPKGTLRTVDFYRDAYFAYLKDSQFKSNICYLMQLIEYELWQYKLFKPQLSLENALFYQLLITHGIIIESLMASILVNPLIESVTGDRSVGSAATEFEPLVRLILDQTFSMNIKMIGSLKILQSGICVEVQNFRKEIRNLVHLQKWDGRLYNQLTHVKYDLELKRFSEILEKIKIQAIAFPDFEAFQKFYQMGKLSLGRITGVDLEANVGQLLDFASKRILFFMPSEISFPIQKRTVVTYTISLSKQGLAAIEMMPSDRNRK